VTAKEKTHCILHLTNFSIGIGYKPMDQKVCLSSIPWKEGERAFSIRFDLNTFCITLKLAMNSYSCLAFILTRVIGTSTANPHTRQ
jgi:hypothetical protein